MAKEDKPKDTENYLIVVMSAEDRIGYSKGDVIDVFNSNEDPGTAVWDDPRFYIAFIKDKTKESIADMLEGQYDPLDLKRWLGRRKKSYDLEGNKVKNKITWEATDADDSKKDKVEVPAQPDEIVIP